LKKIDEQRYLWLCRAQGLFLVMSAAVLCILFIAYDKISPGVKYEAFLVTGNPRIESVKVERAPKQLSQGSVLEVVAKNLAAKYIAARESIFLDRAAAIDAIGRDSDFFYMSSDEEYKRFIESPEYAARLNNPSRRSVRAQAAAADIKYMPKSNIFEAPVTLAATDADGVKTTRAAKAELTVEFTGGTSLRAGPGAWRNPLGFTVLKYRIE